MYMILSVAYYMTDMKGHLPLQGFPSRSKNCKAATRQGILKRERERDCDCSKQ